MRTEIPSSLARAESSCDSSVAIRARRRFATSVFVFLVALFWGATVMAVPPTMTHQGRLMADDGPMTGEHSIKFSVWDSKSGGVLVWESPQKNVDLGDTGFYSVTLGSEENPLNAKALQSDELWIQIAVDGGEPLKPRIKLRSVPFAVRAQKAQSAASVAEGAVDSEAIADGAVTDKKMGNVSWSKIENAPSTVGGLSCSSGNVAVWNGSNWRCQGRVGTGQSCSSGQVVTGITAQGDVVCKNNEDKNTTYDRSCPSGEVVGGLDPDGSVVCVTDQDSGGDITRVNAKNGIKGGGLSGSVPVSVDYSDLDYSKVQERVTGSCGSGKVITGINKDGSANCQSVPDLDGCGTFVLPNNCPSSSSTTLLNLPDCNEVVAGAYCEYDGGCSNSKLDHGEDNCGSGDVYLRVN